MYRSVVESRRAPWSQRLLGWGVGVTVGLGVLVAILYVWLPGGL